MKTKKPMKATAEAPKGKAGGAAPYQNKVAAHAGKAKRGGNKATARGKAAAKKK